MCLLPVFLCPRLTLIGRNSTAVDNVNFVLFQQSNRVISKISFTGPCVCVCVCLVRGLVHVTVCSGVLKPFESGK